MLRFFDPRPLTPAPASPTYVNVKNIHMGFAMSQMVAKLDDLGRPAWIAVMVLGFIVFWPVGLAILAYLLWSGRMECGRTGEMNRWQQRMAEKWEQKMGKWGMQARAYTPTGNHAFDEYRDETLRRLEEEAREFRTFLDRLRMAKDRSEFEQFMAERRGRPAGSQGSAGTQGSNDPQTSAG